MQKFRQEKSWDEIIVHWNSSTNCALKKRFFWKSFAAWKVSKYGVLSGPNTGKYGPEKTLYWTFFTQCFSNVSNTLKNLFRNKFYRTTVIRKNSLDEALQIFRWKHYSMFKKNQINLYETEAGIRSCFSRKLFLKILQYSQENSCVGVSFNKVAGLKEVKSKNWSSA